MQALIPEGVPISTLSSSTNPLKRLMSTRQQVHCLDILGLCPNVGNEGGESPLKLSQPLKLRTFLCQDICQLRFDGREKGESLLLRHLLGATNRDGTGSGCGSRKLEMGSHPSHKQAIPVCGCEKGSLPGCFSTNLSCGLIYYLSYPDLVSFIPQVLKIKVQSKSNDLKKE